MKILTEMYLWTVVIRVSIRIQEIF